MINFKDNPKPWQVALLIVVSCIGVYCLGTVEMMVWHAIGGGFPALAVSVASVAIIVLLLLWFDRRMRLSKRISSAYLDIFKGCWSTFLALFLILSMLMAEEQFHSIKETRDSASDYLQTAETSSEHTNVDNYIPIEAAINLVPEFQDLPDDKYYRGPYKIGEYFGLDSSYCFNAEDTKVPDMPGLIYKSDYCFHFGLRCPNNSVLLNYVSKRIKEDVCVEEDLPLYENPASASDICDYYITPWLSSKDSIPSGKGPVFRYGDLIIDCWRNRYFTTFQENSWESYRTLSSEVVWNTIDNQTGEVLSLQDMIKESGMDVFAKLVFRHLMSEDGSWISRNTSINSNLRSYLSPQYGYGCAIIEEGIVVYYPMYAMENGSYLPYNAVIPYAELEGILTDDIKKRLFL